MRLFGERGGVIVVVMGIIDMLVAVVESLLRSDSGKRLVPRPAQPRLACEVGWSSGHRHCDSRVTQTRTSRCVIYVPSLSGAKCAGGILMIRLVILLCRQSGGGIWRAERVCAARPDPLIENTQDRLI